MVGVDSLPLPSLPFEAAMFGVDDDGIVIGVLSSRARIFVG